MYNQLKIERSPKIKKKTSSSKSYTVRRNANENCFLATIKIIVMKVYCIATDMNAYKEE